LHTTSAIKIDVFYVNALNKHSVIISYCEDVLQNEKVDAVIFSLTNSDNGSVCQRLLEYIIKIKAYYEGFYF